LLVTADSCNRLGSSVHEGCRLDSIEVVADH
jgi:hypothetical protein